MEDLLLQQEKIDRAILLMRGQRVMLDTDLATIYGVKTKRLNEQVKRNLDRFPMDFMFQLTEEEKTEVVAKCDHLKKLKYSANLPYAFTEHGAIMLSAVLNTAQAVQTSVLIVRAFIKMREVLQSHLELQKQLENLEKKYDNQFTLVFKAIKELMSFPPKDTNRPQIGYKIGPQK